jgi:hypothetical protein
MRRLEAIQAMTQEEHFPTHDADHHDLVHPVRVNRLTGLKERWVAQNNPGGSLSGAALSDIEVEGLWQTQS